jgi:hypothetical protein
VRYQRIFAGIEGRPAPSGALIGLRQPATSLPNKVTHHGHRDQLIVHAN